MTLINDWATSTSFSDSIQTNKKSIASVNIFLPPTPKLYWYAEVRVAHAHGRCFDRLWGHILPSNLSIMNINKQKQSINTEITTKPMHDRHYGRIKERKTGY